MATQDHVTKQLDEWLARGEITGDADTLLIKRKHQRFPTDEDFVIRPGGIEDFSETYVRGYNVSAQGLGVLSKTPIPRDYTVLVSSDTAPENEPWVTATVIHCPDNLPGRYRHVGVTISLAFAENA